MELTYDWHGFQSMFYPKRRAPAAQDQGPAGPAYLVVEDGVVLSAYADGDDLSHWAGRPYSEMAAEVTHRELVIFECKDVDAWMEASLELPHFYDQIEYLRQKASPRTVTRKSRFRRNSGQNSGRSSEGNPGPERGSVVEKEGASMDYHRHFLLEALQGSWAKVLPSSYGLFISLQPGEVPAPSPVRGRPLEISSESQNLFVVIRRGRVDTFCEPELSSLGKDRMRQPLEIGRYLSEKYLVPVQSVMVQAQDWQAWSESANPWRQVALAIRSNRAKLLPFRWNIVALLATRGLLGI